MFKPHREQAFASETAAGFRGQRALRSQRSPKQNTPSLPFFIVNFAGSRCVSCGVLLPLSLSLFLFLALSPQSTKAILHFCRWRSRLTDGAISVRFFAPTTRLLAGQKSAYKPVLKCLQFLCGCSKIASASPILGNFRQTPCVSGPLPSFQAASKKPCKRRFQNCIFKRFCFFEKFRG